MRNREFALTDLLNIAIKRIWIILAAMLVGAILALYYSMFLVTPRYQSVSKYLVDTANLSTESSSSSAMIEEQRNTVLSRLIVTSYIEILKTHNFAEHIAAKLESEDYVENLVAQIIQEQTLPPNSLDANTRLSIPYTGNQLYGAILYKYQDELESYTVTVTAASPTDALIIAACVQNESERYLTEKKPSAAGTLKVIDNARFNPSPVNVKVPLSVLLGAFIGAALAFAIAFIVEINDVRVKNEKEISEILGLPVIGSIPEYLSAQETGKNAKR